MISQPERCCNNIQRIWSKVNIVFHRIDRKKPSPNTVRNADDSLDDRATITNRSNVEKKIQILYSPRTSRVDEYYTIIAIIIMPIIFGMCSGMLSKT